MVYFNKAMNLKVKLLAAQLSPTLCDPVGYSLPDFSVCPWNSLGKNTGVGCHCLLQGIFLTQGLNWVSSTTGRFFTV